MTRYLIVLALLGIGAQGMAQCGPLVASTDQGLNWKAKLKKADDLYGSGSYYSAIEYYECALQENPGYADALMGLGMAYYAARDYASALPNFKQAYESDNEKHKMAQYYWGLMQKMTGEYQAALTTLKDFNKTYRGTDREIKGKAKDEYEGCTLAMNLLNQVEKNTHVEHAGKTINDAYTELSPRYYDSDDQILYASLKVVENKDIVLNKGDKMPHVKVFTSKWNGQKWSPGQEMDAFNDKKLHTGNVSFSPDGKKAVFTKCSDDKGTDIHCEIFLSEEQGGSWSDPVSLSFNDKKFSNTHPAFASIRGKEAIIFASNREGGTGGMDLWSSTYERGAWQEPRNLGRKINSWGDEITPYFDAKEDILYYSSNGVVNIGGHDIFKSKISGTRWATPINMGYPWNSSVDDMYYVHNSTGKKGFLVSNREGGIALKSPTCCDDIWSWETVIPPVFWIMGNVYIEGDPTRTPVPDANVDLYYLQADTTLDIRVSSSDTLFAFFRGTEYENFRLDATKQGFTRGTGTTSTVGLGPSDDTVYVDLYLRQIDTGVIVLRNLYFDLDECYIRTDAVPSLDTVYQILIRNPNIQIELASHTDSRNTHEYNEKLSQCRADSSKAWLVKRGIPEERIVAVGYGERKLLNECADGVPCNNIKHQVNRRTEFRVIGEIPGAIVKYDSREVQAAMQNAGTNAINQTLWNFEEAPEGPQEEPQER